MRSRVSGPSSSRSSKRSTRHALRATYETGSVAVPSSFFGTTGASRALARARIAPKVPEPSSGAPSVRWMIRRERCVTGWVSSVTSKPSDSTSSPITRSRRTGTALGRPSASTSWTSTRRPQPISSRFRREPPPPRCGSVTNQPPPGFATRTAAPGMGPGSEGPRPEQANAVHATGARPQASRQPDRHGPMSTSRGHPGEER
jgi:hypothetical protein